MRAARALGEVGHVAQLRLSARSQPRRGGAGGRSQAREPHFAPPRRRTWCLGPRALGFSLRLSARDGALSMKFLFVCVATVFGSVVYAQDSEVETPVPLALTSFTCHGRAPGYYADVETGCKTYHVCDGISHFTYICPRRTLFQQRNRICDHAYRVRCQDSPPAHEEDGRQESVFLRLTDSEDSRGFLEEDYYQTEEYIPTETTPFYEETHTEIAATFLTTPTSTIKTKAPTAATTQYQTTSGEATTVSSKEGSAVEKFLKFRLKDFRTLFFIPEFENNSIVAQPEKELILPVGKEDLLIFKNRREGRRASPSCPAYCNPKFFLPGTCHPCIMIK